MRLWPRVIKEEVVEPRGELDSFVDLELPTQPGQRGRAQQLYDRDLHELVGKLIRHSITLEKRVKGLAREVRIINRKHTAALGAVVLTLQAAFEFWRRMHP